MFHAGFTKQVVDTRWSAFETAFHSFEPTRVAKMDEVEILATCGNTGIIRNQQKIRATVANARHFVQVAQWHGTWRSWLAGQRHLPYEQRADTLVASLTQVGQSTIYYFLLEAGEVTADDKPENVK